MDLKEKGRSRSPDRCCSICLDPVVDRTGARSVAKLNCGHDFHLDCIGSAFNAKGMMQCPNCRKIEKGQWLYANGLNQNHAPPDLDFEFIGDEIYDIALPELPIIHWCPFRGFTQVATSMFEEAESQPYPYYDLMGTNSTMGAELSVGSSSTSTQHDCPYLAQHSMHAPSSSSGPIDSNNIIQYRQMPAGGYGGAHPSADLAHIFSPADVIGPISFLGSPDQPSTSQYGSRIHHGNNRNESPAQSRLGPFLHQVPVFHGLASRGGNSFGSSSGPPPPPDSRSHSHSHSHSTHPTHPHSRTNTNGTNSTNPYQHQHQHQNPAMRTAPNPNPNPNPFLPVPVSMRRVRPRGVTFFSSVSATGATAATSSNAEIGGFYGFALGSGPPRTGSTEGAGEGMPGRHMDRVYGPGPGREMAAAHQRQHHLPWIPLEGESQWWGPFNPMGQSGGIFGQRGNEQRDGQRHMAPPNRPPYM